MPRLASLRRHLSYANAMATVAVFLALGGGAYAAVHVNGKDIKNGTIAGKKIKNRTIAGKKIKNNTLGGKQINEGKLGEVPRAAEAESAASADTAATATTAGTATNATNATSATTATSADSAANAANAAKLGGAPPAVYFVSGPQGTTLFGGVCWDNSQRAATGWIAASDACGNAGGRLPTLSELIAYTDQPGIQLGAGHWSSDVVDIAAQATVGTRDEATTTGSASTFAYRCVFYQTN
jgi:hypothetical protein